ncbi:uncharacterized protein K441DRAFT_682395 [Cenococcum geophilum 1.58]|uniref:Uncharacterized protein n=1 Tax=Cenococcum geophilum 1.58 TaxID=794803 RepID=A0ACC8ENI7_9PEZI|nr:hypothetical protein K441DRAFT_682395 [Cenococcum geophilum 1.58]
MKIFNVLIMCLFSGLTFTIALPATSETEGTAVSTSVIPTETPVLFHIATIVPDLPLWTRCGGTRYPGSLPCQSSPTTLLLTHLRDLSPVKGTSFQAIYSNGDVRFKTWFRNSNRWVTYRYAIACVFRDALEGQPAHVFKTFRTRQLGGTAIGGPGDTHDVDATWNNPLVATHWDNIRAGDGLLHCKASRSFDVADLIGQLIDTVKKYGPIIAAFEL